jgi:hypothetical protein
VRDDDSPTGEIPTQRPGAHSEARTGSVATAEREAHNDASGTKESPTETIGKPGDDPKTETIRTRDEHTKPDDRA